MAASPALKFPAGTFRRGESARLSGIRLSRTHRAHSRHLPITVDGGTLASANCLQNINIRFEPRLPRAGFGKRDGPKLGRPNGSPNFPKILYGFAPFRSRQSLGSCSGFCAQQIESFGHGLRSRSADLERQSSRSVAKRRADKPRSSHLVRGAVSHQARRALYLSQRETSSCGQMSQQLRHELYAAVEQYRTRAQSFAWDVVYDPPEAAEIQTAASSGPAWNTFFAITSVTDSDVATDQTSNANGHGDLNTFRHDSCPNANEERYEAVGTTLQASVRQTLISTALHERYFAGTPEAERITAIVDDGRYEIDHGELDNGVDEDSTVQPVLPPDPTGVYALLDRGRESEAQCEPAALRQDVPAAGEDHARAQDKPRWTGSSTPKRPRTRAVQPKPEEVSLALRMATFVNDSRQLCETARENHAANGSARRAAMKGAKSNPRREAASAANVVEELEGLESKAKSGRYHRRPDECIDEVLGCIKNQDVVFADVLGDGPDSSPLGQEASKLRADCRLISEYETCEANLRTAVLGLLCPRRSEHAHRDQDAMDTENAPPTPTSEPVATETDADADTLMEPLAAGSTNGTEPLQQRCEHDKETSPNRPHPPDESLRANDLTKERASEENGTGTKSVSDDIARASSHAADASELVQDGTGGRIGHVAPPLLTSPFPIVTEEHQAAANRFVRAATEAATCTSLDDVEAVWRRYDADVQNTERGTSASVWQCFDEFRSLLCPCSLSTIQPSPLPDKRDDGALGAVRVSHSKAGAVSGRSSRLIDPIERNVNAFYRVRELHKRLIDAQQGNGPDDDRLLGQSLTDKTKVHTGGVGSSLFDKDDDAELIIGNRPPLDGHRSSLPTAEPASASEFFRRSARRSTALLLCHSGFTDASENAIDSLTDVWLDLVMRIGRSLGAGRSRETDTVPPAHIISAAQDLAAAADTPETSRALEGTGFRDGPQRARSSDQTIEMVHTVCASSIRGGFAGIKNYVVSDVPTMTAELSDAEERLRRYLAGLASARATQQNEPDTASAAPETRHGPISSPSASKDLPHNDRESQLQAPSEPSKPSLGSVTGEGDVLVDDSARIFGLLNDQTRLDILDGHHVPRSMVADILMKKRGPMRFPRPAGGQGAVSGVDASGANGTRQTVLSRPGTENDESLPYRPPEADTVMAVVDAEKARIVQ